MFLFKEVVDFVEEASAIIKDKSIKQSDIKQKSESLIEDLSNYKALHHDNKKFIKRADHNISVVRDFAILTKIYQDERNGVKFPSIY